MPTPPDNIETPEHNNPKERYYYLLNNFMALITLNASRLDQQILPGKAAELLELQTNLRKNVINGQNYADFVANNTQKLTEGEVAKALLTIIFQYITYIEPRLVIFKENSPWVERFNVIKQQYTDFIESLPK